MAKSEPGTVSPVSVIIPCYNQAHYLHEAVASVASQTYQNWECIIVNDGSPDNTGEVARSLIENYSHKNILLLERENAGLAEARNYGIRHARGQYILPLDADDMILPEMLHRTVTLLDAEPDISFVYTDAIHFTLKPFRRVISLDFNPDIVPVKNGFNYCALYRRVVWESVGGYDRNMITSGYEDWDFWVGCVEKGLRGKRIPEALFLYRIKEESMFTNAVKHDAELKAQIVLKHPVRAGDNFFASPERGHPRVCRGDNSTA